MIRIHFPRPAICWRWPREKESSASYGWVGQHYYFHHQQMCTILIVHLRFFIKSKARFSHHHLIENISVSSHHHRQIKVRTPGFLASLSLLAGRRLSMEQLLFNLSGDIHNISFNNKIKNIVIVNDIIFMITTFSTLQSSTTSTLSKAILLT